MKNKKVILDIATVIGAFFMIIGVAYVAYALSQLNEDTTTVGDDYHDDSIPIMLLVM